MYEYDENACESYTDYWKVILSSSLPAGHSLCTTLYKLAIVAANPLQNSLRSLGTTTVWLDIRKVSPAFVKTPCLPCRLTDKNALANSYRLTFQSTAIYPPSKT
ncbi:MAG TPA: hypothetical protein VH796_11805 [Nitrososphaeraceae archaeon]